MEECLIATFIHKQLELYRKHGTPAEFAQAVYRAVPQFLSMQEASEAVAKYLIEWDEAGNT